MNKDPRISNIQIRALIVSTVMGVGVLSLPSELGNVLGKDGWMAIIIGGLVTIPLLIMINQIFKQNPGKDYFEIGKETLGDIIFTICLLVFLVYSIIFAAFITRNLGELIKSFLLPTTPIEFIIILFILSCSYIASYEIDVIARFGYFIYPMTILFVSLFIILSLPKADFTNLLPVFQSDISNLPKGVQIAFSSFAGFEIIFFALPYVEKREKTIKSIMLALTTVVLMYFSLFIMTLTQFSIEQINRQTSPVLMLAKLIDLPGYFLQNIDGLFMAIWVLVVFSTMSPAYFGAGKIMSKMLNTKSHKYFIWILAPIIYWISLIPEDVTDVSQIMGRYFDILSFISVVIIPLLIFIVGNIRKRLEK